MLRGVNGSGGGAPVGGTGTANTIPRWTGASTLGDSGITDNGTTVSFVSRNLSSTAAQTWTLASSTTALNIASGLLNLDTTNARVGVGNAAPAVKIHIGSGSYAGASLEGVRLTNGVNSYFTASDGTRTVFMGADGNAIVGTLTAHDLKIRAGNADAIIVQQGTLNVGIGTASPASRLDVAGTITCDDAGTGLKLPATPGNADTQTLDCYQEGTWTPTLTGFGGTTPTVQSARFTRIGRVVSLQVVIQATGGALFSSTASSTYISLPSGMSAFAPAPGATSNSGIAADGACVAYNNGNLYLPTFALRTADTFLNVTYSV